MSSLRIRRAFCLLSSILVAAGCGGERASGPVPVTPSTLALEVPSGDWYPGDVTTLRAVVRNSAGEVVPGVPVTWQVSSTSRAEVAASGVTTFLAPGAVTITARSGSLSASQTIQVRVLSVTRVTIMPAELRLRRGDALVIGVRVQGEGERDVPGRAVVITSDNPAVALIDGSGRVHAVAPGVTTVRARADGVTGSVRVEVSDTPATHSMTHVGNDRVPHLVASDSVMWDGERQYHEVFLEGGSFELSGGATQTYTIDTRYAEYLVTGEPGRRSYTLLFVTHDRDFGTVERDARGDFRLTSSYIAPLQHTATVAADGMQLHFRIPGENEYLDLLYRRD